MLSAGQPQESIERTVRQRTVGVSDHVRSIRPCGFVSKRSSVYGRTAASMAEDCIA